MLKTAPAVVWQSDAGNSSLHCQDGLALLAALADASVDCIWTDPPYFRSGAGATGVAGKRVSVNKGEWDRAADLNVVHEFNLTWLHECHRVLRPAGAIWVSGTFHIYPSVSMALLQLGFRIMHDIIWEKTNPPPNLGCRCFTHATEATETILWAIKSPPAHQRGYTPQDFAPVGTGAPPAHQCGHPFHHPAGPNRQRSTVWRLPAVSRREKRFGQHPTQKPAALVARCLHASTKPGDLVVDPFAGSATTGCAAIALGRRFIGSEITREYANLGARRLNAVSGEFGTDHH